MKNVDALRLTLIQQREVFLLQALYRALLPPNHDLHFHEASTGVEGSDLLIGRLKGCRGNDAEEGKQRNTSERHQMGSIRASWAGRYRIRRWPIACYGDDSVKFMLIRLGYDIELEISQQMAVIAVLNVHPSRAIDLLEPDEIQISQRVRRDEYIDTFGNKCTRILAQPGALRFSGSTLISDSGRPDEEGWDADADCGGPPAA